MKKQAKYNAVVVDKLIEKYGFKRNYILKCIRGERIGAIATKIKDDYHLLDRATRMVIKNKME
ncbi:hypothetical protein ORI89_18885 [Sphingobacterium sp. UT-1RO-CII-1]|uniref:hypothetical protein n=1 Tax=Sphingobacterium sp. UT-1RO-CII-1 TaxID=2995225 RepID=UPI00227A9148|nr:hypothetical protein [Sphingobacterium sp. UT-1RO-CII-1]MCY4781724.1 hypothetical protein [Sphingobacterium sp. UT-1RO-CII-1]